MKKYQKAINWLNTLSSEGKFFRENKKPSLETVNTILDKLERPDQSFEWRVVVSGTAGKGTVCRLTENVLLDQGKTVATLMSPHLQVITERIRINGSLISAENFGKYILKIKEVTNKNIRPTYYEAVILAGILAAKKAKCQILITEVGLGGELDAVNVVQGKRISALTFIGNDHMKTLGGSLKSIAATKAGIFTEDTIYAISAEKKFTDILLDKSPISIEWIRGISQKMTKKMARKICEKILENGNFIMQKVPMPARWEKIGNVILEGAHAQPRFEFIRPKLKKIAGKKIAIIAMTKNHNPQDLKCILDEFDEIFWVMVSSQDRDFWKGHELFGKLKIGNYKISDSKETFNYIKKNFSDTKVIILGSFYLCGEIRELFYKNSKILEKRTEFPKLNNENLI